MNDLMPLLPLSPQFELLKTIKLSCELRGFLQLLIFKYLFQRGIFLYRGKCYENTACSDQTTLLKIFLATQVLQPKMDPKPIATELACCCLFAKLLKCSSSSHCFPGCPFFLPPSHMPAHVQFLQYKLHSVSMACIKTH